MSELHSELSAVIKRVDQGEIPTSTVRTLLGWFGQHRRGAIVVANIREALQQHNIRTEPDFEDVWIDAEVRFVRPVEDSSAKASTREDSEIPFGNEAGTGSTTASSGSAGAPPGESAENINDYISFAHAESNAKVGHLEAANRTPIVIARDKSIGEATSILMVHGYSQLPVMRNERTVEGMISWRSIGAAYSLGNPKNVKDAYDSDFLVVKRTDSFHILVGAITRYEAVLVKDEVGKICGIVTAEDIVLHFKQLSEPFLLIGDIERSLRKILGAKLEVSVLQACKDPADSKRKISGIDDLSLGECIRLMENPIHWDKIGLKADKNVMLGQLRKVNDIRNDVMHFEPDGIGQEGLETLQKVSKYLQYFTS